MQKNFHFFWQLIKPTKLRGRLKEGNLTLRGVRERVKDSEKKIRMSVKGKFIVYVPKDVAHPHAELLKYAQVQHHLNVLKKSINFP